MMRKILVLILVLTIWPAAVSAQGAPLKVAVTPFAIYSQEDLAFLSQGVQEMVNSHLLERGFAAQDQTRVNEALAGREPGSLDEAQARELGRALGVDLVIYGSLTKVGQKVSLDARVVDVTGGKKTAASFIQVDGLENLMASTRELAQDVAVKVSGQERIAQVQISGNRRIETDAIREVIKSQPGDVFSETVLSQDLRRVYALNYFDDVQIEVEDSADGKVVSIVVEEKPSIVEIEFAGNRMVEDEDLIGVLGYNLYSIMDDKKIAESIDFIKAFYREKGYYNARVEQQIETLAPKRVAVRYDITENDRIYIEKIEFLGNKAFDDDDLEDEMETGTYGLFSWLTDSGIYKEDMIRDDVSKLKSFYYNNGYIKAKVSEAVVTEMYEDQDGQEQEVSLNERPKSEDGEDFDTYLKVTIKVEEGPQYKVGQITISGDLVEPEEVMRDEFKLEEGEVFSRQMMQEDIGTLTAMAADKGYAFAVVEPRQTEHDDTLMVDINYDIEKRGLVYFERIDIVGNDKTRDKVIRRELKVVEGELFSARGLRLSNNNLHRLNYFSDVQVSPSKGSDEDKMNLKIEVEEQTTGAFSVGAGYSSFNRLFGTAEISENNLFGMGYKVSLEGTFGQRTTEYVLTVTDPWLFDIPLAAGIDLFHRDVDYDEYNKESIGGAIRAGYPVFEFTRLSGRYLYEDILVYDLGDNPSRKLREMEGHSSTSAVKVQLRRDDRNRIFNATEGSDNSISVEYAGGPLGGTNAFTRIIPESGWFIPSGFENFTFFVRAKAGWVFENPGGDLPLYEKFYLGGINTIRGFESGDISPRDPATGDKIGGEYMFMGNIELIFPLYSEAGLMGVVFHDQGNVWDKDDEEAWNLGELKRTYGAGIRFYSPFGPLRLEYGRVIDPQDGEPESNWEFTVGTFF